MFFFKDYIVIRDLPRNVYGTLSTLTISYSGQPRKDSKDRIDSRGQKGHDFFKFKFKRLPNHAVKARVFQLTKGRLIRRRFIHQSNFLERRHQDIKEYLAVP